MKYLGIFEDTCLSQYFPLSHFPEQVAFNTQLFKTHSPPTFEHAKLFQLLKSQNIWNIKNEFIFPALILHTVGGYLQHKTNVG